MFLKLEKLSDSSHRVWFISIPKVPWVLVLSIGLVFSFSPLSRIPFFLLLFFTTNGRENRISKKREKTQIRGTSRKRERNRLRAKEHQTEKNRTWNQILGRKWEIELFFFSTHWWRWRWPWVNYPNLMLRIKKIRQWHQNVREWSLKGPMTNGNQLIFHQAVQL